MRQLIYFAAMMMPLISSPFRHANAAADAERHYFAFGFTFTAVTLFIYATIAI